MAKAGGSGEEATGEPLGSLASTSGGWGVLGGY